MAQFWPLFLAAAALAGFQWFCWRQRRRRRARIARWAQLEGWAYVARDDSWVDVWHGHPFGKGMVRRAQNVVTGSFGPHRAVLCDYSYRESGDNRYPTLERFAVHALDLPVRLPWTHLSAERTTDRLVALAGGQDIELESDAFNRAYRVRSDDPRFASDLLNPRTMELLLRCGGPDVRIGGGYILLVTPGPLDPPFVGAALTVLASMLENLPDFVWSDRGARAPRRRAPGRPA